MYYSTQLPSPLGLITLVCSENALVALRLPGQAPFEKETKSLSPEAHPVLAQTARWLGRYFAGEPVVADEIPLDPEGTPFQKTVWRLLSEIPYGQTVTYGELARKAAALLGKPRMSAQAVGQAVGANPIAIIIPCHRCLGVKGNLTGYAGGLDMKRALLDLEHIPYIP